MDNISNLLAFLRLFLILLIGGTIFKACISLMQGKKFELNLRNPMNLKARWPIKKEVIMNESKGTETKGKE
ncbi:hypothetical protein [Prochlorococcus sp. MIT 1223]|uniref:hypothetical protein n=1 Tax=Prochlorococcus sp. MIT 1223 TaxID=3096217 RepID=UPI002A750D74|nr:hypothetical protein [Prochlorococcus sp. MIT 1223]